MMQYKTSQTSGTITWQNKKTWDAKWRKKIYIFRRHLSESYVSNHLITNAVVVFELELISTSQILLIMTVGKLIIM